MTRLFCRLVELSPATLLLALCMFVLTIMAAAKAVALILPA